MEEQKQLPNRKHPRLKEFDYSSAGGYFITICTQNRCCTLSHIEKYMVGRGLAPAENTEVERGLAPAENIEVGRGLAPAENTEVGRGLAPAIPDTYQIKYTKYGKIAEQQLKLLEKRYPYVKIDQYVIMPNHIHMIMILEEDAAGASPRPTIMDIICAYKSLTTRECKKEGFHNKLFQTSFYEHIIRDREDYETRRKYIYENPSRWYYDELYVCE